jgi:enamine deaminase RidA (YjgF/YER057c/UK114 family)
MVNSTIIPRPVSVRIPQKSFVMDGLSYNTVSQAPLPTGSDVNGVRHALMNFGFLPPSDLPVSTAGLRPSLIVAGDGSSSSSPSAMQTIGIDGVDLKSVSASKGDAEAIYFATESAEYLWIRGLYASRVKASRSDQTRQVFDSLVSLLESVGMGMEHVLRTWFYLDDILDWYGEFGSVRNHFFEEHGVFDGFIPASTGIGGTNPFQSALALGAVAMKPKAGSSCTVMEVDSPLQCAATQYRSAFSRAVEIGFKDARQLLISGTASIDGNGLSVYPDDVDAQIAKTMEVVAAILVERNMSWENTVRGIAYFADHNSISRFHDYCIQHGICDLPVICVNAAICRDDLLFELELDAVDAPLTADDGVAG